MEAKTRNNVLLIRLCLLRAFSFLRIAGATSRPSLKKPTLEAQRTLLRQPNRLLRARTLSLCEAYPGRRFVAAHRDKRLTQNLLITL